VPAVHDRPLSHTRQLRESSYGSDVSGLVYGFGFSAEKSAQVIDTAEALRWLLSNDSDAKHHQFLWLHFSRSNLNSEKWLRANLSLPDHFYETLQQGLSSTHIEQVKDSLIAVISDFRYDFGDDASQISTLFMCVKQDIVVSIRLHPLRSVDQLRTAVANGEVFASPISLLAHLLRDQAEILAKIIRDASAREDDIEDHLLDGKAQLKRGALGALRRVLVRLGRLLAPEPNAISRLLNRPPHWFSDDDLQELRSATEEFTAILGDLVALQERTKLLQEEMAAHVVEQTNRSLFLLTIVTVIALPINLTAGLLGMNVGGIPLSDDSNGFWLVFAIVTTFTMIAFWFANRKQHD
jgi:zinc transporter